MRDPILRWLQKYNLLIFDTIDSTNSEALRMAGARVIGKFVIWAYNQTAGRGRNNKLWHNSDGNLYFSILLDNIDCKTEIIPQLSFVAAISVYDALNLFFKKLGINIEILLKWPNDVLIAGKKVAGILIETKISAKTRNLEYIVLGIGVNVNSIPSDLSLPQDITCLSHFTNTEIDISRIMGLIVSYFDRNYTCWRQEGFFSARKLWLKKAYKINHVVTIVGNQQRISGVFKDIDLEGNIRVKLPGGMICSVPVSDTIIYHN